MIELMYPMRPAPVLPALRAGEEEKDRKGSEEMLPVVDASGEVIGQAARSYVHGGSRLLHPVVHLHIIDRLGRLYIQKRSSSKDLYPGRWDTAVGGHVGYGETVAEALVREASEELKLFDFNPVFLDAYIHENEHERELVNVFATIGSFRLRPDPDEVSEGRYWTFPEIEAALGGEVFTPNFESEFTRYGKTLEALL